MNEYCILVHTPVEMTGLDPMEFMCYYILVCATNTLWLHPFVCTQYAITISMLQTVVHLLI